MRCKGCDVLLNEREIKRKDKDTKAFLDLCNYCYKASEGALGHAIEENMELFEDNYPHRLDVESYS